MPGQTEEAETIELGRCCVHARQSGSMHICMAMKLDLQDDSILLHDTGAQTDAPLL